MQYREMTRSQRDELYTALCQRYETYCARSLKLDMSRGKPNAQQLALSEGMLDILRPEDCITETGLDCRNYGLLDGIPEAKRLFAQVLVVSPDQVMVTGNSSLNMMYDEIVRLMLFGAAGVEQPWCRQKIKFLCPVPGYDRHFSICQSLGIEMIPVEMKEDGPDMDVIEAMTAQDESIKGIWCVPKYSNPQGLVYSDEVVRRFAALTPAARDFRIFWDNAYVVHVFDGPCAKQLNLLNEAKKYGREDQVMMFTSTSKISFPGSGVAVFASSKANLDHTKKYMNYQTIGYDKLNMMRHVRFFGSLEGIVEHMKKHAEIIRPRFAIVCDAFRRELAPCGIANWTEPKGGYFISLDLMDGCAKRVYDLALQAGVKLTTVGATFPYGKDPRDRNLRIAPTYPTCEELTIATEILCLCIRIASLEKLAQQDTER